MKQFVLLTAMMLLPVIALADDLAPSGAVPTPASAELPRPDGVSPTPPPIAPRRAVQAAQPMPQIPQVCITEASAKAIQLYLMQGGALSQQLSETAQLSRSMQKPEAP